MFVVSFRLTTLKVVSVLAAVGVVVAVAAWPRGSTQAASVQGRQFTGISTNEKRVAFLESYGWKVSENPVEVVEVTIPQTFNAVYSSYNNIQRKQGLDLTQYKGQRVKRWTYRVTNYPGVTDEVRADLLICNDRVIAGDVCTVALNGFMHGFSPPATGTSGVIAPSAADIVSTAVDIRE